MAPGSYCLHTQCYCEGLFIVLANVNFEEYHAAKAYIHIQDLMVRWWNLPAHRKYVYPFILSVWEFGIAYFWPPKVLRTHPVALEGILARAYGTK